jgi:hypothetical protein
MISRYQTSTSDCFGTYPQLLVPHPFKVARVMLAPSASSIVLTDTAACDLMNAEHSDSGSKAYRAASSSLIYLYSFGTNLVQSTCFLRRLICPYLYVCSCYRTYIYTCTCILIFSILHYLGYTLLTMPSSSSTSRRASDNSIKADINDEQTPLLATISPTPIPSVEPVNSTGTEIPQVTKKETPFNRLQVLLLCYTRVVEPIAFFSIFPYINSMIEHVGGIEKEDVGFYSGLIESLFSATQMCVMILWGKVITTHTFLLLPVPLLCSCVN